MGERMFMRMSGAAARTGDFKEKEKKESIKKKKGRELMKSTQNEL